METISLHHLDNYEDVTLLFGSKGIERHATYLASLRRKDGTPYYPHLQTDDGIALYVDIARRLMKGYLDGTVEVVSDREEFKPDTICGMCPHLHGKSCTRGI